MKKYILTAAVSLVATGVYAQSVDEAMVAESYSETITEMKTDFKSNWFISAGVGGQIFFGDHDRQASFGDRLSPALDIAVGSGSHPPSECASCIADCRAKVPPDMGRPQRRYLQYRQGGPRQVYQSLRFPVPAEV